MDDSDRKVLDALQSKLEGDPGNAPVLDWVRQISSTLHALEREVKKQRIDFSTVIEIANQINSKGLDITRIEAYATTMMRGQFGVVQVLIFRQVGMEDTLIRVTAPASFTGPDLSFSSTGAFAENLVQVGSPITAEEFSAFADSFPEYGRLSEGGVDLIIPLVNNASDGTRELKGLICLGQKIGKRPFTDEDRTLARVLGDMVAISLHNAQLYHRSIVDGLTQVYSRGHFDVHFVQELARARRFWQKEQETKNPDMRGNRFVSLVMVDIDHFKEFNDSFGHQTGDAVLRAVAKTLHDSVRTMDIVARYGGEEFALVFPETRKEDALRIAERLRQNVEATRVETGADQALGVTVSLGVATFPDDGTDLRDLVAKADDALYRAKGAGRNQVISA